MAQYLSKEGLAYLYGKLFSSVSISVANGSSSSGATRVLNGGDFRTDITPEDGYYISSVTVTMDGVDITSQVFEGVEVGQSTGYVTASEVSAMIDDALAEYGNGDTESYG